MSATRKKLETIFDAEYPTGRFLQGLVDDAYFISIITTDNNQSQSIIFRTIPTHKVCEERSIDVELLPQLKNESKVGKFNDDHAPTGVPSEVQIPLEVEKICAQLVVKAGDASTGLGVQFLVDDRPVHTQPMRAPLKLKDGSINGVKTVLQQVLGFPANDGKQTGLLSGISTCSCLCVCTGCTVERENFGNMSECLWKLWMKRLNKDDPCP